MIQKRLVHVVVILVWSVLVIPFDLLAEEEGQAHREEPHHHRHHVALFVGGTHAEIEIEEHGHGEDGTVRKESEDALTVGLDYEYRLTSLVGVGGVLEYASEDLNATVAALSLFLHPIGGLKFILAPGVEYEEERTEFLFRTGVYYDVFFGNVSVAPVFSVDFVDGEQNLVYGISVGYGF